ncbi:MAG: transcriptional regulator, Crp/Fnr family [Marmoricola sp.]|nr:transcriptional regulator, Crp/Fnr family [Marmoricola sp.]
MRADPIESRFEMPTDVLEALKSFTPAVAEAWATSWLASVSPRIARILLADAHESRVAAGQVFYRGAYHDQMAMSALVVSGQLRIYRQTDTGRQVTMMYHYPGAIAGAPALLLGGAQNENERARQPWQSLGGMEVYGQALQDSGLLKFSPARFLHLVKTEPDVAWALSTYLAQLAAVKEQMMTDDMFLSVQARVARHLIDLAVPIDGALTVTVGHQEIADAIGSVREVVTRSMVDMRLAGLITREGNKTVVTDAEQLRLIASAH